MTSGDAFATRIVSTPTFNIMTVPTAYRRTHRQPESTIFDASESGGWAASSTSSHEHATPGPHARGGPRHWSPASGDPRFSRSTPDALLRRLAGGKASASAPAQQEPDSSDEEGAHK